MEMLFSHLRLEHYLSYMKVTQDSGQSSRYWQIGPLNSIDRVSQRAFPCPRMKSIVNSSPFVPH
jgi:hypothetical protein